MSEQGRAEQKQSANGRFHEAVPLAPGIREKELFTGNFVISDGPLSFLGHQPINKTLPLDFLDMRVFGWVNQNYAVLVEEPGISFDQNAHVAAVFERQPGSTICQDIAAH